MCVVGTAEDGASGLHLIADVLPDVVMLDVHLPDISGVEVARRVRAALPDVGIVVVTGFDDPSYAKALLQLGVRGYVTACQSPSGWDHGFSAFGGVELARWLVGDCLGEEYLDQTAMHYAFKSQFLNKLPPSDWIISEGEVRSWADDHGLLGRRPIAPAPDPKNLLRPALSERG